MSKKSNIMSDKSIVQNQFMKISGLQRKIQIINDVNDYHENQKSIGDKSEKIRFKTYMEVFDQMMYDARYTVLLEDDSMIFLYYEFDENGKIVEHVLSYLPNFRNEEVSKENREIQDKDDRNGDADAEISSEVLHRRLSNFIRVDYENEGRKEYFHSLIHMHIGTEREALRIPVEHCVMPFDFLFFVLKYIYHICDEQLICLESSKQKEVMLTEKERKKLKLIFNSLENE